ncbi:phage tail terminator protein [Methylophilus sp. VKM B-3414]|uniref:phage tail terminator protein n=1 Tax=Methylophilus sp. VKM B-3414 TaxID=3076121 RepID=UPI0028C9B2BF|nr:phage tail terminator protein [Methylophilus sp. VKM B-3414]MDT7849919.1 phage tail terminator protein [Methylophilus sp. VKM B-3414]
MAHARTQIREAVKAHLTSISAFNGNVFSSRFSNLQTAELPSVTVFSPQENNDSGDIHGFSVERTLQLAISIKTAEISNIDIVLDDLCEAVEIAMDTAGGFGGLVKNIQLTATQIQINEDAAEPVGEALLQYQVTYFTQANNPAITL